jgi:hypothetical protein
VSLVCSLYWRRSAGCSLGERLAAGVVSAGDSLEDGVGGRVRGRLPRVALAPVHHAQRRPMERELRPKTRHEPADLRVVEEGAVAEVAHEEV